MLCCAGARKGCDEALRAKRPVYWWDWVWKNRRRAYLLLRTPGGECKEKGKHRIEQANLIISIHRPGLFSLFLHLHTPRNTGGRNLHKADWISSLNVRGAALKQCSVWKNWSSRSYTTRICTVSKSAMLKSQRIKRYGLHSHRRCLVCFNWTLVCLGRCEFSLSFLKKEL